MGGTPTPQEGCTLALKVCYKIILLLKKNEIELYLLELECRKTSTVGLKCVRCFRSENSAIMQHKHFLLIIVPIGLPQYLTDVITIIHSNTQKQFLRMISGDTTKRRREDATGNTHMTVF